MRVYKIRKTGFVLTKVYLNELEGQGKSEQDIADILNISRMGLFKIRSKMGWAQSSRSDKGIDRVPREIKLAKRAEYMRELYHAGKIPKYKHIRIDKVTMAEHRYIASQALGRALKPHEHVHHIDGDPLNNNKNNLLICSASYHRYLHRMMKFKVFPQ